MSVLERFTDVFASCIDSAYRSVAPSEGIDSLLNGLESCLVSAVSRDTSLSRSVSIRSIRGKIFMHLGLSPIASYSVVREVGDVVLMIERNGRSSLVFIQVKNARANLDSIRSRGSGFETVIGSYDPRRRAVVYADKGQLLMLSGFFERRLYLSRRGGLNALCDRTFIACNELPMVKRLLQDSYFYTRNSTIPLSNRVVRVVEYFNRVLMLYTFSVIYEGSLRILAMRSSDLLYLMSRTRPVPYRLGVIEGIIENEFRYLDMSSVINDVSRALGYFNSVSVDWKIKGLGYVLRRQLRDQLSLLLGEQMLIDFTRELRTPTTYYGIPMGIGRALVDLVNSAMRRGRLGRATNDCVIRWSAARGYTVEDLRIGRDIPTRDEYLAATEGTERTLLIRVRGVS